MVATLQILISLLAVIAAVAVASKRLKVPPAILLVVTGVALALIPGLPKIELAPQLVLLLILPPIIYMSAVAMSWREFRFNLRPIVLLAFGSVIFTTVAIADNVFVELSRLSNATSEGELTRVGTWPSAGAESSGNTR